MPPPIIRGVRTESTPGPDPGYRAPAENVTQPVTGVGRPRSGMAPPARSKVPAVADNTEQITSPGAVAAPRPLRGVGFSIPWQGMNGAGPQPTAEIGKISYNPYTGEWFNG